MSILSSVSDKNPISQLDVPHAATAIFPLHCPDSQSSPANSSTFEQGAVYFLQPSREGLKKPFLWYPHGFDEYKARASILYSNPNIPPEFTDQEPQHRQTRGICVHDKGEYSWALDWDKERQLWSQSHSVVLFWDFHAKTASCMGSGDPRLWTVFSWLRWQILIILLKVSQNLWQEFLLEIKLFVSPLRELQKYKQI